MSRPGSNPFSAATQRSVRRRRNPPTSSDNCGLGSMPSSSSRRSRNRQKSFRASFWLPSAMKLLMSAPCALSRSGSARTVASAAWIASAVRPSAVGPRRECLQRVQPELVPFVGLEQHPVVIPTREQIAGELPDSTRRGVTGQGFLAVRRPTAVRALSTLANRLRRRRADRGRGWRCRGRRRPRSSGATGPSADCSATVSRSGASGHNVPATRSRVIGCSRLARSASSLREVPGSVTTSSHARKVNVSRTLTARLGPAPLTSATSR